jgi:CDP-diacylglycerol--glycerol-3-phosphate 3-phosphatidyltransferase
MKYPYLYLQLLTVSRVFLAAGVAAIFAGFGLNVLTILAAAALGGLAELTDLYDGILARKHNLTSDFGKFFDPYTDSIARLIMYFALTSVGLVPLWLPAFMALRDVTVSYVRLFAMKEQVVMASRMSGKVKAWGQGVGYFLLLIIGLLQLFDLDLSALAVYVALCVLLITLWSLIDYVVYLVLLLRKTAAG